MLDFGFIDGEVINAGIVVLTALAAAIRRYRRTGSFPFKKLPWNAIRKLIYELRALFFTSGFSPDRIPINTDIDSVKSHFGTHGYEIDWPFSYHYENADENLRRYFYDPDQKYPHRQMHVRLYERDDGTADLYAHEEPSALHHPKAHLSDKHVTDATAWVVAQYEKIGSEGDPLDPTEFKRR